MGMMIYKYAIPFKDSFELELPTGACPLCVSIQHDLPVMWASFDETNKDTASKRMFIIIATGHVVQLPTSSLRYIGTIFWSWVVGHVFEVIQEE